LNIAFLAVTAVVLLGAAATFRLWGRPLLRRPRANPEVTGGLQSFLQLALWLAGLATVVLLVSSLVLDAMSTTLGWFGDEGSQESAPSGYPVLAYFPLHEGTTSIYSYTDETDLGVDSGVFAEAVAAVPSDIPDGAYLAEVAVTGRRFLSRCLENDGAGGDSEYWVVSDGSRLYIACSGNEADSLATEVVRGRNGGSDEVLGKVPEFVSPFRKARCGRCFRAGRWIGKIPHIGMSGTWIPNGPWTCRQGRSPTATGYSCLPCPTCSSAGCAPAWASRPLSTRTRETETWLR
jgi:hypothetical protein